MALAELGRIWWNLAEYGRIWQNMADCRRLPSDCRLVVGLWLLSRWKQVDVYKGVSRDKRLYEVYKDCEIRLIGIWA